MATASRWWTPTILPRAAAALSTCPGGIAAPRALQAVLSVLPIDTFIAAPCAVMQVVGEPGALPPVVAEMNAALVKHGAKPAASLERHAFYAAAETAYTIVQTGERRFYGNILLTKGVVAPRRDWPPACGSLPRYPHNPPAVSSGFFDLIATRGDNRPARPQRDQGVILGNLEGKSGRGPMTGAPDRGVCIATIRADCPQRR